MTYLSGFLAGDGNDPAWTLHQGEGERTFRRHVTFLTPFNNTPLVSTGLTGIDVSYGKSRVYIGVDAIDSHGFDLEVKTWSDTQIWAVVVNWTAIGL